MQGCLLELIWYIEILICLYILTQKRKVITSQIVVIYYTHGVVSHQKKRECGGVRRVITRLGFVVTVIQLQILKRQTFLEGE